MSQDILERIQPSYRKLVQELSSAVAAFYGDRLISLVLYGSVVRGCMRPDSDLDFVVVAEGLPRGSVARNQAFDAVFQCVRPEIDALEADGIHTILSPLIKLPEEARYKSPVFLDMVEHRIILYDREGFFQGVLDDLARRMAELGSRKVVTPEGYWWDLAPNAPPGTPIEL